MGKYILSLDQGTTSSRAVLFGEQHNVHAIAQAEYPQIYLNDSWVEHDPDVIYSSQMSVIGDALAKSGADAADIAAIGITNQRETTIIWDKETGKPVYNAIVWQCRRTARMIDKLIADGMTDTIRSRTGLVPDAYFSASKIAWILDHISEGRDKARSGRLLFGTVDTWLVWNMTNGKVHVTDYTNASRTMLFNIHTLEWDDTLLEIFDIPKAMLPSVCGSSKVYGYYKLNGCEIPIAAISGDQQAALFGQCCFDAGDVKNTYGTGCFMLMNTGTKAYNSKSGLITTIAASTGNRPVYALEGSVFSAGSVVKWLRDELALIKSSDEIEGYAGAVDDSGGVYFVPAFTGLGTPHWDMYARGCIIGITGATTRSHILRAALESIAFQSHDVLTAMENDTGISISELRVDGGASVNNLLMQIQADISSIRVVRPAVYESTALGAAYLAGLATGVWSDTDELKKSRSCDGVFEPQMKPEKRSLYLSNWEKAVKRSLDWSRE